MTTTYRLHVDELDPTFVDRLKTAFADKVIEIQVMEADETDNLLSNTERRERLLRAVADVEAGKNLVVPDQIQFR